MIPIPLQWQVAPISVTVSSSIKEGAPGPSRLGTGDPAEPNHTASDSPAKILKSVCVEFPSSALCSPQNIKHGVPLGRRFLLLRSREPQSHRLSGNLGTDGKFPSALSDPRVAPLGNLGTDGKFPAALSDPRVAPLHKAPSRPNCRSALHGIKPSCATFKPEEKVDSPRFNQGQCESEPVTPYLCDI
jgi:hypothetical protein